MTVRGAEQLKHLEFVQAVISRLHIAGLSIKRFALTGLVIGASLARITQESLIVLLTLFLIVIFLDSRCEVLTSGKSVS